MFFFNDKMYVCSLSYLMAFSLSLFPGLWWGDIKINTSANAVREPANQCFRLALFLVWSKCIHTVNVNLIEGINLSKTVVTSLSLLLTTYRRAHTNYHYLGYQKRSSSSYQQRLCNNHITILVMETVG